MRQVTISDPHCWLLFERMGLRRWERGVFGNALVKGGRGIQRAKEGLRPLWDLGSLGVGCIPKKIYNNNNNNNK